MMHTTNESSLESIDQKTMMAGQNRMELLVFMLGKDRQPFGINVFKVREVIPLSKVTKIPHAGENVIGMANIRDETIPIIDLSRSVGVDHQGIDINDSNEQPLMIVTEYNRRTQAFLVNGVDRILNKTWDEIKPPPEHVSSTHYLTAITQDGDNIVGILDVERVLTEIDPAMNETLSEESSTRLQGEISQENKAKKVMIIDDSAVARNQLVRCMEQLGIQCDTFKDGEEAYNKLSEIIQNNESPLAHYSVIVCDIEMPKMDGYTFTKNTRDILGQHELYIVMHSSLSGVFNHALVEKVGANDFIAKFDPEEMAEKIASITG